MPETATRCHSSLPYVHKPCSSQNEGTLAVPAVFLHILAGYAIVRVEMFASSFQPDVVFLFPQKSNELHTAGGSFNMKFKQVLNIFKSPFQI